jgi:hypothetical protein
MANAFFDVVQTDNLHHRDTLLFQPVAFAQVALDKTGIKILIGSVAVLTVIVIIVVTCVIIKICKKGERFEGGPSYSVAVSNSLFKERVGSVGLERKYLM